VLRIGSPEEFARAESLFKPASFDEATLCRLLKLDSISEIGKAKPTTADMGAADSQLMARSGSFCS
jgi:hypothetical protein